MFSKLLPYNISDCLGKDLKEVFSFQISPRVTQPPARGQHFARELGVVA